ncbi:hypothetical protein SEA_REDWATTLEHOG_203 [Gordonia phage RedWattleHog]|nr:hypothetical protein SEA_REDWATTLEHOG_203 [Gordonia phage RedWattleHog]
MNAIDIQTVTIVREGEEIVKVFAGAHRVRAVAEKMFPESVQQTWETLADPTVVTHCIESRYFVIRGIDHRGDYERLFRVSHEPVETF